MFIFGKTTLFLLQSLSNRQKIIYVPLIIAVLFIFTNADKPMFDKNECEKNAMLQISQSTDSIVKVDYNCSIVSWAVIEDPQDSKEEAKLLKIWGIIKEDKLFYHKSTVSDSQLE